jgi:preprotein translocase subunit SecE
LTRGAAVVVPQRDVDGEDESIRVSSAGAKVTWPTRKETLITTVMVFVMVILAAIFFLVADQVLSFAVSFVLGIGR